MNPPSLPYHGGRGPVNILKGSSAKFPQAAQAHPACPENLVFMLRSGRPSKVKQFNGSGVGAIRRFFPYLINRFAFAECPER